MTSTAENVTNTNSVPFAGPSGQNTHVMEVSKPMVGRIIGRGGETINMLQTRSGKCVCTCAIIDGRLKNKLRDEIYYIMMMFDVSDYWKNVFHNLISVILTLSNNLCYVGTRMQIDQGVIPCKINITGSAQNIGIAMQLITELVQTGAITSTVSAQNPNPQVRQNNWYAMLLYCFRRGIQLATAQIVLL